MQIEQPDVRRPVLIVAIGFLPVTVSLLAGLGTFSVVLISLVVAAAGTLMILLAKVQYVVAIDGAEGSVHGR